MSSLSSLSIQGIRSFGPSTAETIEFFTPLTIIVGHNGAGKTTVIECLKYASCGELPPNSKGAAFIHDPKLAHEIEIKAQVRLRLINTRGQKVLIVRSLQCSIKKEKIEYRTLENILAIDDDLRGASSVSGRCSDLDAEVPNQLGVSKAVLENVIFCHQEDSQWPLSDSATLKRKFDDIFAASQYTKILVALRKMAKEMEAELKIDRSSLALFGERRDYWRGKSLELELVEAKLLEKRSLGKAYEDQVILLEGEINSLEETIKIFEQKRRERDSLFQQLQLAEQTRDDLSVGLIKMHESSSHLISMLSDLDQRALEEEERKDEFLAKKHNGEKYIADLSEQYSHMLAEKGAICSELSQVEERNRQISIAENELHSILGIDDNFSGGIKKIALALSEQEKLLADNDGTYNDSLQKLLLFQSRLAENRKIKRSQLNELQANLNLTMDKISKMEEQSQSNGLNDLDQLIEEEANIAQLKEIFQASAYETRISLISSKRHALNDEIHNCQERLSQLHKIADIRARSSVKRSDLARREENLARLVAELSKEIKTENVKPLILIESIENAWRGSEVALKSISENLEKAKRNESFVKSKLEHASSVAEKHRQNISLLSSKISHIPEHDKDLDELSRDLSTVLADLHGVASSKGALESFQRQGEREKYCPLCERPFKGDSDLSNFTNSVLKRISSLPDRLIFLEAERRSLETQIASLRNRSCIKEEIDREKLMLSNLETEMEKMIEERDMTSAGVLDLQIDFGRVSLEEKRMAGLRKRAEEVSRLLRELNSVKNEVDSLNDGLSDQDISIEAVQLEISNKHADLKTLQNEMDILMQEQSKRQNELFRREARCHNLKESVMKSKIQRMELDQLQKTKSDIEENLKNLEIDISGLNEQLEATLRDIQTLKTNYDAEHAILELKIKDLKTKYESSKVQWALIERCKVENEKFFKSRGNYSPLDQIDMQIRQTEESISYQKSIVEEATRQLALFGIVSEIETLRRKIHDNIKIRELEERIAALQEKLAQIHCDNISKEYDGLLSQFTRLRQKRLDTLAESQRLVGVLGEIESTRDRLTSELLKPECANAESDYRKTYVTIAAKTAAISDLARYTKAFDQAIMRYHVNKMDEINKILAELWTTTYQGVDIDAIAIRTDLESTSANALSSSRSYNYRVVMLKSGVELDMRGRSSAGQRVLASLLIRLALAETFGHHCGILALDEPTTNLDRDNIEGLARALAEVVASRRGQRNFQLILITHDQEFVEALGRQECADYYYRISRDQQT